MASSTVTGSENSAAGFDLGERPLVARVLLDTRLPQLDHLFDDAVPPHLRDEIAVGQRVKAPLRSRHKNSFGWVVELAAESEFSGKLAELAEIVSPVAQLRPDVWALARAVADRAAGSACDVLRLAIPSRHVRAEKKHLQKLADAENVEIPLKNPVQEQEISHPVAALL
ncbi:MAG: hypothetical protein Q4C71_03050, partial [Microbacteriaceae bacterium]|nr:hypothetical protein [Microbacteriaceae bacterium]